MNETSGNSTPTNPDNPREGPFSVLPPASANAPLIRNPSTGRAGKSQRCVTVSLLHPVEGVRVQTLPRPEDRKQDRKPHAGFSGGDSDGKDGGDLPLKARRARKASRPGEEGEIGRVQHEFHAHEHEEQIPSRKDRGQPEREKKCGEDLELDRLKFAHQWPPECGLVDCAGASRWRLAKSTAPTMEESSSSPTTRNRKDQAPSLSGNSRVDKASTVPRAAGASLGPSPKGCTALARTITRKTKAPTANAGSAVKQEVRSQRGVCSSLAEFSTMITKTSNMMMAPA